MAINETRNDRQTRLRLMMRLIVLAAFTSGCQRTLVNLTTPESGAPGAEPAADERTAVVHDIAGLVETRPNADSPWTVAVEGQALTENGQIRTGTASRVMVRLTEGSKIRLGPETEFGFHILNPYLDSLLTSLTLERGAVWVLLNGGALDVETPLGIASAREAYLSVAFDVGQRSVDITCLQGTCSFGSLFIPTGYKLLHAESNTRPEPLTLADFGAWGVNVPEATQLAALATEAVMQGSATLPVVSTNTPAPTATLPAAPTPTSPAPKPSPSPVPPTPVPPAPTIGQHTVLGGETLFCIARGYGVLPAAIAQANGLAAPFTVYPGQRLKIPAVQWSEILAGPVCAPQFQSPYPGLPLPTNTPLVPPTPAPTRPPLKVTLNLGCVVNCGSREGEYGLVVQVTASGGASPYTYTPSREFYPAFPHCVDGTGTVSVVSADGQVVSVPWIYHDVSCPATSTP